MMVYSFCKNLQSYLLELIALNFRWKEQLTFRNLMFAIICRRHFSKLRISVICGGVFFEVKPNVSFLFMPTLGFKKKNAFHLICLQRSSVFSISAQL